MRHWCRFHSSLTTCENVTTKMLVRDAAHLIREDILATSIIYSLFKCPPASRTCAAHMTWDNMSMCPDCLTYFRLLGQWMDAFLLRVWGKTEAASGMPEASHDYPFYDFWILIMVENTSCISEFLLIHGESFVGARFAPPHSWHTSMSTSSIRCRKEMGNPIDPIGHSWTYQIDSDRL